MQDGARLYGSNAKCGGNAICPGYNVMKYEGRGLRCNTGEYPRVRLPVIFSKAITRTQRVFRHGYPRVSRGTITNTRGIRGTRWSKSGLARL